MKFIEKLKFNQDGLIPAIVQEEGTGRVLMMAWMNESSLQSTIETQVAFLEPLPPGILDEGRVERAHAGGERSRV